jgi:hypothetical protein
VDREVDEDVSTAPRDLAHDLRSGTQEELLVDLRYATPLRNTLSERLLMHGKIA